MKVLIIEDEKLLADSLKALLESKDLKWKRCMMESPGRNMRSWASTIC